MYSIPKCALVSTALVKIFAVTADVYYKKLNVVQKNTRFGFLQKEFLNEIRSKTKRWTIKNRRKFVKNEQRECD